MSTQQASHPAPPPPGRPTGQPPSSSNSPIAPRIALVAIPVLVAIGVLITRPEVFQAVIGSPQAIAIVAGIVAAVIGWSAILRKLLTNQWLITGLVLAPLAVVAYLFIAPYYAEDVVVDEALPGLETSAVTAEEPATAADTAPMTAEEPDAAEVAVAEPEDAAVDAPEEAAAPADALPEAAVESPDQGALEGEAADQPPAAPAPTGPVQLSNGSFVGLDNHFAEGVAAIYQLEDGSSIVRLEDVNLQQVPEAVVYLVPGADQTGLAAGSINVGALTGNVGSSNYAIPADVDLSTGDYTVLVWCEVFASPVGGASQVASG